MSIRVEQLTYIYNPGTPFEKKAIDGITLEIQNGEFIGIIGHTGSGKSTFIQHLNALISPTSGSVYVDGVDIHHAKNKSELRRRVGLVFQYPEYQLFDETVYKDCCFGPRNMGLPEEDIREHVTDALKTVGLDETLWEKSPFELSGGQKRRAAIAGVLAMHPEVLILDEPAAGLDPAGRNDILQIIETIHSHGTTVIMVSHSMDDVARLCSRIIVLEKGRIAMDGTCAEVFSNVEKLNSMGLRLPQAALLRDRLIRHGMPLDEGIYNIEDLADALLTTLSKR